MAQTKQYCVACMFVYEPATTWWPIKISVTTTRVGLHGRRGVSANDNSSSEKRDCERLHIAHSPLPQRHQRAAAVATGVATLGVMSQIGLFLQAATRIGITFGLDPSFFHSILSDQTFIIIIIIIFIVTSDEINCNSVFSSASEMTYIVSGGALNSTHSLNCNLGLIHVTKMFPCVFY